MVNEESQMPGGGGGDSNNGWVFNGQEYYISVSLHNSEKSIPINVASIISLSVTESIYSIFPSVSLVLDTSSNIIENTVHDITTNLKERVFSESFNFDADGREMFFIALTPTNNGEVREDDMEYQIVGWYYIYDEDESLLGKGNTKHKTYYLRDVREQTLIESNLQWSTVDVIRSTTKINYSLTHLGNAGREAKTGTSIKHLLSRALDVPQLSVDSDWDDGETSVYYSSPSQYTAYDDLEYMLDRHVSSSGGDNCILKAERDGNFSLRSVEKYFTLGYVKDDIAPLICDAFIGESGNFNTSNDPDVVGNVIPGHAFIEQDLIKFDGLDSFSLLHVANIDSSGELISNIVHSYDTTNKQFNIECDKHHITNTKSKLQELYADKMPGHQGNITAAAILPINEKKFDNVMVNHSTGPSGTVDKRLHIGINKTLRKSLYFSPTINFEVTGSSHRTTCRFILLSLRSADKDAPLTKLLVGEWFISKVNHSFIFAKNAYINNISCIKPHSGEPLGGIDINKANLLDTQEQWGSPPGSIDLDNLNLQEGEAVV